uniref:C2H2-type domain-containing protein n=1 Tax=Cacopsylla melanoneura TaxID=428564 RepID=A0A8D9EAL2_9HEMI
MFWVFKRTKFTNSAVNFFQSFNISSNNNNGNTNTNSTLNLGTNTGSKGNKYLSSKKVAYNKLSVNDTDLIKLSPEHNADTVLDDNGNQLISGPNDELSDNSSTSDFDLEEEDEDDEFSDESEFDESLTCNVCDRTFCRPRQLEQHQQKKRHFGCSTCDTLFQSLMALEHHKAEFEHWSGDEMVSLQCTTRSESEDDSCDELGEELERLL